MGKGKNLLWEMLKVYLKSIGTILGARWVSPRDSIEDPECAVMEVDLDLMPAALNHIGAFLLLLQRFDRRVNTDHPIFRYLGEAAENGEAGIVTITLSLKRRSKTR